MKSRGRKHLNQFFSSDGAGGGTVQAIGDYSGTPLSMKLQPDDKSIVEVHGFRMNLRDSGNFTAGDYGSLAGGLVNGIRLYVRDENDNIIEELTNSPIKTNADLAAFANFKKNEFDTNDNVMSITWDLNAIGEPVLLDFSKGEYLEIYLNDNFTGLTEQSWIGFGFYPHEYYPD